MRVLMISLDASLLSDRPVGDVLDRLRAYAEEVGHLTVLVFGKASRTRVNDDLDIIGTGGSIKPIRFIRGAIKARALARSADLVTAQDPFFAGLVAYWARQKAQGLAIEVHGDFFGTEWKKSKGAFGTVLLRLASHILSSADGVRVVNESIARDISAIGISTSRIHTIPVLVNIERFTECSADLTQALTEKFAGHPVVLSVGRIEREKGIYDLIDAFALFLKNQKSAQLVIVGSGKDEDSVRRAVAKRGLQPSVHFEGVVSPQELSCYYHLCDVFVLASHHESFGRVILEAGAAGAPVVATMTAGARLLLDDRKTGYLTKVSDVEGLCNTLEYVWKHLGEARIVGELLKQKVLKEYDHKEGISRLISFWKQLVR